MDISFKVQAFEGPLDLLLHLIEKNQVDIYDIPIAMITDQYLAYLSEMEKHDADITSDFLVMAATLLDIKARMLLPKDTDAEGNEEDPRAELVEKLIEYKTYKFMSLELKDKAITASKAMYKGSTVPEEVAKYEPPVDLDKFLGDLTLARLKAVFDDVLKRSSEKVNEAAMRYGRIQREEISISDKIVQLRAYCSDHKEFPFPDRITGDTGKHHRDLPGIAGADEDRRDLGRAGRKRFGYHSAYRKSGGSRNWKRRK